MSNPIKGEVGFEVEGKPFTLVLDINAMCAIEQELGITTVQFSEMLSKPLTSTATRAIFWAGLQDHHEAITLKGAGRMIQAFGAAETRKLIFDSIAAAWPSAEESPEGGERPRKAAKAGTG